MCSKQGHVFLSCAGSTFLFLKIRLAEVEQASLMSEQLSDKSSSPALPDDLSLDDHSVYQLVIRDMKVYKLRDTQPSINILSTPQRKTPQTLIILFLNCPSNLNLHALLPDELINACLIT